MREEVIPEEAAREEMVRGSILAEREGFEPSLRFSP